MRTMFQQLLAPRCPQCGESPLFRNMLSVAEGCPRCGLVLKHHDTADGPTFFAIIIIGFLVVGLASVVELRYSPPLWLHAMLWLPLTLIGCIVTLRTFKTLMITIEHWLAYLRNKDPHD